MPGIEAITQGQAADLYPPDYDPLTVAVERLGSSLEALQRIIANLENRLPANDIMAMILPGTLAGSAQRLMYPRIRGKRLVILPVGTGEPTIRYGSTDIFHTSIQGIPVLQDCPFPFVWQEGNDIILYDAITPTVAPAYTAIIIGTSE